MTSSRTCKKCGTPFRLGSVWCRKCGQHAFLPLNAAAIGIVLAVVAIVGLSAVGSGDSTGSLAGDRPAPVSPAEALCLSIESAGNGQPGKTQRCHVVKDDAGKTGYVITIRGDYGDDALLIAVSYAREVAIRDSLARINASAVVVAFPEKASPMYGRDTLALADIRACLGQTDERLCLLRMF